MKKWIFILLLTCTTSLLQATAPEKVENLSSKVILKNADGYFVLTDGSLWKAIPFSKRWRTMREWWNNVQLAPENYDCLPNDWVLGTTLEIYPKYENLQVNEADASNQEALKQCTHLLYNNRTGQILFAISLQPSECLPRLFKESREEGYDEGYQKGKLSAYQNADEIFKKGRAEGYKAGYKEGFNAARDQTRD